MKNRANRMLRPSRALVVAVVGVVAGAAAVAVVTWVSSRGAGDAAVAVARPALTVAVTTPQAEMLATQISANGTITAWQEASIGTEANGLRLITVIVNVGDVVRRGQVLAVFESSTVTAELAQSRAAVAEAEAALAEARDNAQRANGLQTTGALSEQQIRQYMTAERTAKARLDSTQAAARTQELRLAQTQVLAPDDGVISARTATVGAVLPAGQELFRLIRRGRLEWRAEVAASDLANVKPGQVAHVTPAGGEAITGTVRMVGPTIDTQTRNGLVYVDLPPGAPARAGMFARGAFDIETGQMMTLPQTAVLVRDGFSYVLRIGSDSKVMQTKVSVGRRAEDRIEITGGIDASTRVVVSGGAFLGDGDLVRVIDDEPSITHGGEQVSDSATAASLSGGAR
jgi:RND family efflux transporter MFP subunit